jgi:hypothetical protein
MVTTKRLKEMIDEGGRLALATNANSIRLGVGKKPCSFRDKPYINGR